MASRRKNFIAPEAISVTSKPGADHGSHASVHVGESLIHNGETVDLSSWLGKGFDEWVWASVTQLKAFISGGAQTQASVFTYGRQGMPSFFEFIESTKATFTPATMTPRHVGQFVAWLKDRPNWSPVTKRNRYTFVKSMLMGMRRRQVVSLGIEAFPHNPFPQASSRKIGETPLSPGERSKLAEAIRLDVIALHHGAFSGTECDGLTVYLLALGLRTGMNTTPMLELQRNAVGPHPFIPNMRLIRGLKRRGNSISRKALRTTRVDQAPISVPMDGVALLEKVLERTQPLLADAGPRRRDHVWLYRVGSTTTRHAGQVRSLNSALLAKGITNLVDRHELVDDEGARLRLNLSRLRKTMENRLWRLSNGDLFTVSLIMGHDQKVADQSYLRVTDDMRQDATIVGEALPAIYRDGATAQTGRNVTPIHLDNTPVGSCKDTLFGDMAPKDGHNHCARFVSCFNCRSYALVGSSEDLYRLFSFYWFLTIEITRIASQNWKEHFAWILSQIDAFTASNFDPQLVNQEKLRAKAAPHKFWKNYQKQALEGLTSNGN